MYKSTKGLLPDSMSSMVIPIHNVHDHNLRNQNGYYIQHVRTMCNCRKFTIHYTGPIFWNTLPQIFPFLHKFHFSVFVGDVPCPTQVTLLSVWWRFSLSYISSPLGAWENHCLRCALSYMIPSNSQCVLEMCPVLHKFHFSVFAGNMPCST